MPVFTNPISSQNQGSAAGIIGYPAIGSIKQYIVFSDEFNREVLNPTGTVALYTQANNAGTGTTTMTGSQANIATTGSSSDDTTLRTSELVFTRTSDLDFRTQLNINITFNLSSNSNVQYFVGIVKQVSQLTGLPTTTRHLGCYVDTSASNNMILSSANGTSQVTTDTLSAVSSTAIYKLTINLNGDDSAVITLSQSAAGSTSGSLIFTNISSQTVTSLCAGSTFFSGNEIHFYVKTLTTATKTLAIREYNIQAL